ncbi:beta-lactamase hydrolase domain-containing protein [Singulisphaera sp. PoT]|uniref:beta-lactamase hydrolase domain-containing protein n=1 Tax=Singulisphaera sp. PoT TaxID=3411797 RepID=UPI003BF524C5
MNFQRAITPAITIADQPTAEDLEALKGQGYVGVVNLRNDGEPEQPLSTSAEGEKVKGLGLDYVHYGVGSAPLTEQGVTAVSDFLSKHGADGKVLVHCRKGARAAALVLLHEAKLQHWSPEEALANGRAMGLEVEGGLKNLVENYLRDHASAE